MKKPLIIKIVDREPSGPYIPYYGLTSHKRKERIACGISGCTRETRDQKSFCPDHIENQPYINGLLTKMRKRREQEDKVCRTGIGSANLKDEMVKEILSVLRIYGKLTIKKLTGKVKGRNAEGRVGEALEIQKLATIYCEFLETKGLVSLSKDKRGILRIAIVRTITNGTT